MARQKIADFFAELGIKVNERSLKTLEKNLSKIVGKLEKAESAGRAMSGILRGTSKAADAENKSIQAGNKVLAQRQKQYEKLNKVYKKIQQNNSFGKINAKTSVFADPNYANMRASRWRGAIAKNAKAWQTNFRESVGRLTGGSSNMTNKARNAQQAMYNQLFGAKQSAYEGMDKSHAAAMREDMRRSRAAQNLARIQENVARREAIMAQRTAAIREAGAKRAAAIITAAELKAQAIASRMGGGGAGRPSGRGMFGSASMGGAFGAASSNIAGFLPGFGAAYSLVQANRINQEIQGQKLAMASVMGSDQLGAGEQSWMKALSQQIGLDYRATLPAYTRMMASGKSVGLETGNVRNIFQGISEYGRVMGLDSESMKGTMRAVEQMLNKGQVMSEELKGQLMLAA